MQPKRKKPKAKPFSAVMSDELPHEETTVHIPPPTPIKKLQQIGQDLGIEDKLLTVEKLMADPLAASNNSSDDQCSFGLMGLASL